MHSALFVPWGRWHVASLCRARPLRCEPSFPDSDDEEGQEGEKKGEKAAPYDQVLYWVAVPVGCQVGAGSESIRFVWDKGGPFVDAAVLSGAVLGEGVSFAGLCTRIAHVDEEIWCGGGIRGVLRKRIIV